MVANNKRNNIDRAVERVESVAEQRIILDLCGGTAAWSSPFRAAGYDTRIITLPEFDVTKWATTSHVMEAIDSGRVYGVLCAPPCTMFSRARTTAKTARDFREAMRVVTACLEVIWECEYRNPFGLQFWAMENPRGHLERFLGRPAYVFQPYYFGDKHSKETCLWGRFKQPMAKPVGLSIFEQGQSRNNTRPLPPIPADYIPDGKMKPVQIRRSITPPQFAQAFFEANHQTQHATLHCLGTSMANNKTHK